MIMIYLSYILNCDETPITFDSPLSYTLSKIGKKTISVKTLGNEKKRLTCLLTKPATVKNQHLL